MSTSYHVGFTGTQVGMSLTQTLNLVGKLWNIKKMHPDAHLYFHHGDCIGSDREAAFIALSLGYQLIEHPGDDPDKRAYVGNAIRAYEPMPMMNRNQVIVVEVDELIATPRDETHEVTRSGTWSTVRRARKRVIPINILARGDL